MKDTHRDNDKVKDTKVRPTWAENYFSKIAISVSKIK